MTKEGRVAFLAILTVALYTLSVFISYKKLLFPFPLFDVILWIVVVTTFVIQIKSTSNSQFKWGSYFYLIFVNLKLFSNAFVLSFFIPFKGTELYVDSLGIQFVKFIALICLILSCILWVSVEKKRKMIWITFIAFLAIILELDTTFYTHLLFCPIVVLLFFTSKSENPWKYALIVHAIFDLITFYYVFPSG